MDDQDFAFLAYAIAKGKGNLSTDETKRLTRLAGRHLQSGDRVTVALSLPPNTDPTSTVSGVIDEVRDEGFIKVTLDQSIETQAEGMTVETDTIVVQRSQVQREETTAPAPAPTSS